MRRGDLQFRDFHSRTPEIVRWSKDSKGTEFCYTLMFFEKDSEGFNINFIGGRPLEYENPMELWTMMKYAQKILTARFELENA